MSKNKKEKSTFRPYSEIFANIHRIAKSNNEIGIKISQLGLKTTNDFSNKNIMSTYKVKQEDLTGQLKGFPIEIVQKMVDEQTNQGYNPNVEVFKKFKCAMGGGFSWEESEDGVDFWESVIMNKDFKTFFDKYPKQEQSESKYCNLYHNNATMKFKTGEHTYSDSESAYENRKEDSADGYRYFTTIECSIQE